MDRVGFGLRNRLRVHRILHINTQFCSMGGVEAVLRAHHGHDGGSGMDSRFIALWEPAQEGWPRCRFLDFQKSMRVRTARGLVGDAWPGFTPGVAVHHTLWGQPYWQDLDQAPRRALFLHSDVPGLAERLVSRLPAMDAVLAVSDTLLERAREAAPSWGPERFQRIHYPVFGPVDPPAERGRPEGGPIVLGYAGRLVREQKRVERFVELAAALDRAGVAWRLEFLGDGEERTRLEAALPDRGRVIFHGRLQGEAYWKVIDRWDALVLVSDYEGTPIALLEAMTRGVVPLHPRLGSGGDAYATAVDPALVYAAGDIAALAKAVAGLAAWPTERWIAARRRSRELMTPHGGAAYLGAFRDFMGRVQSLPAPSRPAERRWKFPGDRLTFAQWEWLLDWRRRVRRRG